MIFNIYIKAIKKFTLEVIIKGQCLSIKNINRQEIEVFWSSDQRDFSSAIQRGSWHTGFRYHYVVSLVSSVQDCLYIQCQKIFFYSFSFVFKKKKNPNSHSENNNFPILFIFLLFLISSFKSWFLQIFNMHCYQLNEFFAIIVDFNDDRVMRKNVKNEKYSQVLWCPV